MKKGTIAGCAVLATTIWMAVSIYRWKKKTAMAVAIIGGADGPTSVFLAGKVPSAFHLGMACVAGLFLLVLVILLIWQQKKKK